MSPDCWHWTLVSTMGAAFLLEALGALCVACGVARDMAETRDSNGETVPVRFNRHNDIPWWVWLVMEVRSVPGPGIALEPRASVWGWLRRESALPFRGVSRLLVAGVAIAYFAFEREPPWSVFT